MRTALVTVVMVICMQEVRPQPRDKPRGPWKLALKVVSGKWDSGTIGESTFWDLFTSSRTYSSASPIQDTRDFTTSSDHYKSSLVEDWGNKYISVQAIKLSFFKNNEEKAYVVFDGVGKSKSTWFKCDNILYSSYSDLPDSSLGEDCPGKTTTGFPLNIMKLSFLQAKCSLTTGWVLVADTDLDFSICTNYAPDTGPRPYFKYAMGSTLADMSTELETADSMAIFFQVWDMVFKGITGVQPTASTLSNLTGLYLSDLTENDNSDVTIRNLHHVTNLQLSGIGPTYKSGVIDLWESYFLETAKFSMLENSVELAYVIFNAIDTTSVSWFAEENILYSSFGSELQETSLDICSIEGDSSRHWQIQSIADEAGCTDTDQMGWMLVKEPKHNGSCAWDGGNKKPYFMYNPGHAPTNPSNFQYADVMAVFVHGWRMVFKIPSSLQELSVTSVFDLWSQTGSLNEDVTAAVDVTSGSPYFKSSIIDQWETTYVHAVKLAAYKNGQEVFHVVFDATGSGSNMEWMSCDRILYTTAVGMDRISALQNSYTCSIAGDHPEDKYNAVYKPGGSLIQERENLPVTSNSSFSHNPFATRLLQEVFRIDSPFRLLIGKSPDCGTVSFSGVFAVLDIDNGCSTRTDLPVILYSNVFDDVISESSTSQEADTVAIFFDMDNCYEGLCTNGGTCQDIGGNFRCFCVGLYYGDVCDDLDGTYTAWSEWSSCSVNCGDGTVSRNRTCQGTEGNGVCVGLNEESDICSFSPCPVNGGFAEWSIWSDCTKTCESGTHSRTRTCTNPEPQHGGVNCSGDYSETTNCNTQNCPIHGGLTEWSTWGTCTELCGTGTQTRTRSCTNPTPQHGGDTCTDSLTDSQTCNTTPCPIHGGLTEWSPWGTCTELCGTGTQTRTRSCTNPTPQHGGDTCTDSLTDSQNCNTQPCPIHGGLTEWSTWGTCTELCGTGTQTRTRSCTNPTPEHGGDTCTESLTDSQSCNTSPCPIHGGLTQWSTWDACTELCGTGTQTRTRSCTNPTPEHGGNTCTESLSDSQSCNTTPCSIHGGLTEWSTWGTCTELCGTGTQTRTRSCTNPTPQHGGDTCTESLTDSQSCNTSPCPIHGGLTEWSTWDTCTELCGTGTQTRTRSCTNPTPQHGGDTCTDSLTDSQNCNTQPCPIHGGLTKWSTWGTCSELCGTGTQTRTRSCTNPTPQHGGDTCTDSLTDSQSCNTTPCPIHGGLTEWSTWNTCTELCGTGTQTRTRSCTNPAPQHGGDTCTESLTDSQSCNTTPCPIHGGLTEWSLWGTCTELCDTGTQTRTRSCTNPTPQHGGDACSDSLTDSQNCNTTPCPIHGGLTEWSTWGTCSELCGTGAKTRTRSCTNPTPQYGGDACTDSLTDSESCNTSPCPIHGGLTEWTIWGTCTELCGTGTQTRTRSCTNPTPQHGGDTCTDSLTDSQTCNTTPCPIHGGLTEWSTWGTCTELCGTGTQTRTRSCTNPTPQHGGDACSDSLTDSQTCNTTPCPIHGGLTQWSTWGTCTEPCGTGTQTRTRSCTNPTPQHGGDACTDSLTDSQTCNTSPCPIHGGLTEWSTWGTCTELCGTGTQTRTRSCTNPTPQHGGDTCTDSLTDSQNCNTTPCPIHGGLTEWSTWGTCTELCGTGTQTRTRSCTNPTPQHGGDTCTDSLTDSQSCNTTPCPIHGGLTEWSTWGTCTELCGTGTQTRTRSCTNPTPQNGGDACTESLTDSESCNTTPCPIHGGFNAWSGWSGCSVSCGGGSQTRYRNCTNPEPQYGGANCAGSYTENVECNISPCSDSDQFTNWSDWTECSLSCGSGEQTRERTCTSIVCEGALSDLRTCNTQLCPVNGGYSEWSEWQACTVACGTGRRTRSRSCTNPTPENGGQPCTGPDLETEECNTHLCPIDGGLSTWSDWGNCSVTCGTGIQERTRSCTNPSPDHGGLDCTGVTTDSQGCIADSCPVNGGYSEWSEWQPCTVACGTGSMTRSRSCTNPTPENGGQPCTGPDLETEECNTHLCPIDGGLSTWSDWGNCSVTCGTGIQERTRSCTNPSPDHGGLDCTGVTTESQGCIEDSCPVHWGYSEWGEWQPCTVACGTGSMTRSRSCTNPTPEHGGQPCTGPDLETEECNTQLCPIDGGFSTWLDWGNCSVTCGTGIQERTRSCTNPSPDHGGLDCTGVTTDSQGCIADSCPVDGGYSEWSEWQPCTVLCGTGSRTRSRSCTNPNPENGGQPCTGADQDTEECNTQLCPIDGGFSTWLDWGNCSVTCGTGIQERTRLCTNPSPDHGGLGCTGVTTDSQGCIADSCPVDGDYTEWSEWQPCTVLCGTGGRTRSRSCTNPAPEYGGQSCTGPDTDTEECNTHLCPIDGGLSTWSDWGDCSVTCGTGIQERTRSCTNPSPDHGGLDCAGSLIDSQNCEPQFCPVDGNFTTWSDWSVCSQTCGVGSQIRFRTCSSPIPQYGGEDCMGSMVEYQSCQLASCPVNGRWTMWLTWSECSVSCETGIQYRSRSCISPTPQFGGMQCEGPSEESRECNTQTCPIAGGFTDWGSWSDCSKTCDAGFQIRLRECTNPVPQHGGTDCVGTDYESKECLAKLCSVDGSFASWSLWSDCTVTCEGGTKTRTRSCIGPFHGGTDCVGETTEQDVCNVHICPVDGYWHAWSDWTLCTATCNGGISVRVRQCVEPSHGGNPCQGLSQEIAVCEEGPCPKVDGDWSNWSTWISCSQTCGTGHQTRSRTCTEPAPLWGGAECTGNSMESDDCVISNCPVDGVWSQWQGWSSCFNMTNSDCEVECECGSGVVQRTRTCSDPPPENGGLQCEGERSQAKSCFVPCLKVQCDADHPQYCQVVAVPKTGRHSDADSITGSVSYTCFLMCLCFIVMWCL